MAGGNLPRMSKEGRKHVRVGHIRHGSFTNQQGQTIKFHKGSGWHHRPGGRSPSDRRLKSGTRVPIGTNGVYSAKVEYFDPGSGKWLRKGGSGKSTFFPDNWTNQEVMEAIEDAKANGQPHPSNADKWVGRSRGINIEGYNSGMAHGWPTRNQV